MGKTHTFKIGEYCKGGVITVEIGKDTASIIAKDWDTSTGYNKGSNQSNAKEFDRETIYLDGSVEAHQNASMFLNELTTHYYAEQVMDWMVANSTFKKHMFW